MKPPNLMRGRKETSLEKPGRQGQGAARTPWGLQGGAMESSVPGCPRACSSLSLRDMLTCHLLGRSFTPTSFLCFVFLHHPHSSQALSHLFAFLLPVLFSRIKAGILVCCVHCWAQGPDPLGSQSMLVGAAVRTGMSEWGQGGKAEP